MENIAQLIVALVVFQFAASALAQQAANPPFDFPAHGIVPPEERYDDRRIRIPREDRVITKGLLAPATQDRLAFERFLQQRNTGLMRLLPREIYDHQTYRTKKQIDLRGGGAYYSFAFLTHAYGYGSDLELDHGFLSVGFAGADYGILTSLGDVALDEITVRDSRARFMATYEPPRSDPKARCQRRRFVIGETIDGQLYKSRLPAQVGATYLLRSINYDESDVLVAFRVARSDDDGSVIIVWKLLKEYAPRKLENINAKSECNGPIIIVNRFKE